MSDILLDDKLEPLIQQGDYVAGDAEEQHLQLLLLYEQGHLKETPLAGVGIQQELRGPFTTTQRQRLSQRIRLQLELDGYRVLRANVHPDATLDIETTR